MIKHFCQWLFSCTRTLCFHQRKRNFLTQRWLKIKLQYKSRRFLSQIVSLNVVSRKNKGVLSAWSSADRKCCLLWSPGLTRRGAFESGRSGQWERSHRRNPSTLLRHRYASSPFWHLAASSSWVSLHAGAQITPGGRRSPALGSESQPDVLEAGEKLRSKPASAFPNGNNLEIKNPFVWQLVCVYWSVLTVCFQ